MHWGGPHFGWWSWWWWWLWIVFIVLLVFLPLGYGWGYRGWGPPPTNWRERPTAGPETQGGWGAGADFVWLGLALGILWLFILVLWWAAPY